MSYLLAVDPDVSAPGLALFRSVGAAKWELTHAGRVRSRTLASEDERMYELGPRAREWVRDRLGSADVSVVVLEWPRVYPAGRGKPGADPNDLIELAGAAIAVYSAFPGATLSRLHAREWKGTVPKPKRAGDPYLVEARVLALLTPAERAVWERDAAGVAPTPRLEITDAVGLGLHATGRPLVGERVITR